MHSRLLRKKNTVILVHPCTVEPQKSTTAQLYGPTERLRGHTGCLWSETFCERSETYESPVHLESPNSQILHAFALTIMIFVFLKRTRYFQKVSTVFDHRASLRYSMYWPNTFCALWYSNDSIHTNYLPAAIVHNFASSSLLMLSYHSNCCLPSPQTSIISTCKPQCLCSWTLPMHFILLPRPSVFFPNERVDLRLKTNL